jgi:hypothetical protein
MGQTSTCQGTRKAVEGPRRLATPGASPVRGFHTSPGCRDSRVSRGRRRPRRTHFCLTPVRDGVRGGAGSPKDRASARPEAFQQGARFPGSWPGHTRRPVGAPARRGVHGVPPPFAFHDGPGRDGHERGPRVGHRTLQPRGAPGHRPGATISGATEKKNGKSATTKTEDRQGQGVIKGSGPIIDKQGWFWQYRPHGAQAEAEGGQRGQPSPFNNGSRRRQANRATSGCSSARRKNRRPPGAFEQEAVRGHSRLRPAR